MMSFKADLGNVRTFRDMLLIRVRTKRAIEDSWYMLGRDLRRTAVRDMANKSKSGRTYNVRVRGRIRRHTASAPGETHADLSRELSKSTGYKVDGFSRMRFGYGVGSKQSPKYDESVEKGTDRMNARPSIENTVKKVKSREHGYFRSAMLRQFKAS